MCCTFFVVIQASILLHHRVFFLHSQEAQLNIIHDFLQKCWKFVFDSFISEATYLSHKGIPTGSRRLRLIADETRSCACSQMQVDPGDGLRVGCAGAIHTFYQRIGVFMHAHMCGVLACLHVVSRTLSRPTVIIQLTVKCKVCASRTPPTNELQRSLPEEQTNRRDHFYHEGVEPSELFLVG